MNSTENMTKLLGNSIALEGAFLYSILKKMDLIDDYIVNENDFISEEGKKVYQLIKILESKGIEVIDRATIEVTLMNEPHLKAFFDDFGGASELFKQINDVNYKNIDSYYDDLLKRNYLLELKNKGFNIYQYADKFKEMNFEECVSFVEYQILNTGIGSSRTGKGLEINVFDLTDEFIDEIVNGELFESLSFAETCPILNGLTNGLVTSAVMLLAAPSNTGKSTFAVSNIIYPIIKQGEKVLLISNEMTFRQYMSIFISVIASRELGDYSVTRDKILKGTLSDAREKLKRVQKYIRENLYGSIEFVNYNSGEIEIVKRLMKKYSKKGFKLAVYDNLKAENSANTRAWAELIEHTKELVFTAQECKMAFLAPYQVAPSSADKRVLTMSDLAEGKGVITIVSTALMFRRVKNDEYDGCKYAINPYTFVKNKATGKWDKTKINFGEECKSDQYIIMTITKNRFGKNDSHLLYKFESHLGTFKEIGYCSPIPDYIK